MGRLARGEFRSAAAAAAESGEPLIRETATWALDRLPPGRDLAPVKGEGSAATGPSGPDHAGRRRAVLTTVERVLILKEVGMFSAVQDEYLADIAPVLTEAEVPVGTTIIRAGDIGRTMYVIITGRVRVHRDGLTLAELGEREVFGELAALDPEPRSASVEALEDTRVFQLSNEHLDELMAVNVEIARGIIRMLCRRFRSVIATSGARLPGTDQGSLKAAE
jgi:hypothetical protein